MLTEYSDEFDTLGRLVGIFIVAPLMYNAGVTGATDGPGDAWHVALSV